MIAHVADRDEARGRVVIQLSYASVNPAAFDAAIRIARAFNSEIECLFVENVALLALAQFPFAREIATLGNPIPRSVTPTAIEQDMQLQFASHQRQLTRLAHAADVPFHSRIVRDEPVRALALTCAACGPWNVVVLTEPFGPQSAAQFSELFATVADATGIVVVGRHTHNAKGPVILALEDAEALPGMLRAGERFIEGTETRLTLALIAGHPEIHHWLESQARLVIGDRPYVDIIAIDASLADPRTVAEHLRRQRASFMIARFGGITVPADDGLGPLSAVLACPLLLVR